MNPEHHFYPSHSPAGPLQLAYTAWGQADAPKVICVHGLTRNSRDFDPLAQALAAQGRRVICPDMVGRGLSDWLPHAGLYGYPQMLADLAALFVHLQLSPSERVMWVGTSMGGLLGMMLAAQPATPLHKLVLNDIGPFIPAAALTRLGAYVGANPHFTDLRAAEAYLREIHQPFGITCDADWQELTRQSVRADSAGGWRLQYDPAIGEIFKQEQPDIDLWPIYGAVRCETLVLRGASSDLLTPATAYAMTERGPRAHLVEILGCGHAPALRTAEQIAIICDFLASG